MRIHILVAVIITLVANNSIAQPLLHYYQSNIIEVQDENGVRYLNPFGGGLKSPLFSSIDLNFDGKPDLVVLDRADDRLLTFINEGVKDTVRYIYRPEYERLLPDTLNRFFTFVDFNNDGKPDIYSFASSQGGGIEVYRNISFGNTLKFELFAPVVEANNKGDYSWKSPVFLSGVDVPAILDMDRDGDIDILTADMMGGYFLYIKNKSVENFGRLDTFDYDCVDEYWGYIMETDNSSQVILGVTRPWGYKDYSIVVNKRHAGSTILLLDNDNDKDLDLLLGDAGSPVNKLFTNGKADLQKKIDTIISQRDGYPFAQPYMIHTMPGYFNVDVDNDTIRDLLASPMADNITDSSDALNQVWYYKNKGKNSQPDFQLVKRNFLQEDMIDFGGGTSPAFLDFDGDGDQDLFVATQGNYRQTGYDEDRIVLFQNIGTDSLPVFKKLFDDYLGLTSRNYKNLVLTFGDIDNDGDQDMLMGQENGKLILFTNNPQNDSAVFTFTSDFYKSIDIGSYSAPAIADLNADSLSDLIIGTANGRLSYFKNTGTKLSPDFTLQTDTFGGIIIPGGSNYIAPVLYDMDTNGYVDLLFGANFWYKYAGLVVGKLFYCGDISRNPDSVFIPTDTVIFNYATGKPISRSMGRLLKPALANLDGDKIPDLVLGSKRGGLQLFVTNTSLYTSITANGKTTICPGDSLLLNAGNGFDSYAWNTGQNTQTIYAKQAGNYECTVRKGSFSYKAGISVLYHSGVVKAEFTYKNDNRKVTFTMLNSDVDSVYWDFGDSTYSGTPDPVHTYKRSGNYTVCLKLRDVCGAKDSICKNLSVNAIVEQINCRKIRVYPNPVDDKLLIVVEDSSDGCCYKAQMYDVLGRNLYQRQTIRENRIEISTYDLKPGIYFLQLFDESGKIIRLDKIIKMRY